MAEDTDVLEISKALFIYLLAQCQKPPPPAPEFSALKQRGGA
jgi:hypothetical protein